MKKILLIALLIGNCAHGDPGGELCGPNISMVGCPDQTENHTDPILELIIQREQLKAYTKLQRKKNDPSYSDSGDENK